MPDKDDVPIEAARALLRSLQGPLPDKLPSPPNSEPGSDFERHLIESQLRRDGREIYMFPPHLRALFDALGPDGVARLQKLMNVKPETVAWIDDKSPRELRNLDGAVEFITSSRTAAKALIWVGGMAVAFVGGVTALAKNGIDLFAILRGGR